MCSFFGTNKVLRTTEKMNRVQKLRGPDLTNVITHRGVTMGHNLLSITGTMTPQPFVKGAVAIVFNGEIYNYRDFGTFDSDGQALMPLYEQYGNTFPQKLDGEFAIAVVDSARKVLVLSTDVFGTKPLWFAREGGQYGFASYRSALVGMGFKKPERIPPNTTRVYTLDTLECVEEHPVYTFDLRQHKTSYDDVMRAFEASIRKRSVGVTKKIFLGLSGGYDSGAIASELERQGVVFKVFSIEDGENKEIIHQRLLRHAHGELFSLSYEAFLRAKHHVKRFAEPVNMVVLPGSDRGGLVSDNTGAVGLSDICRRARSEGYRVFFSGQGADEILSDYGFAGKKFTKVSVFGGLFPESLESIFPWRNFFDGTERAYLDKEETVAGSHGIETRYPFLDTQFVQEFLWLTPELKNAFYKAPLHEYFTRVGYPFEENEKFGFSPAQYSWWEKCSPRSLWYRLYWYVLDCVRGS
jgi:asparagine synthetase B (glutamine-hydrolysing)